MSEMNFFGLIDEIARKQDIEDRMAFFISDATPTSSLEEILAAVKQEFGECDAFATMRNAALRNGTADAALDVLNAAARHKETTK